MSSQTIVKTIVFIAEYVTETTNHTGIVSAKNRFSIAVAMDTVSDSEPLFYRAGEDEYYNDEIMCDIISSIRSEYPDCAITLSIGRKKPRDI